MTALKKEKNWVVLAFGLVAAGFVLVILSPLWVVQKLEAESNTTKGKGGQDEE